MNGMIVDKVYKWMKLLGFQISRNYISQKLQSHAEFPSLVSITDTLDEIGINNISLIIENGNISELPRPFLAHIKNDEFVIVDAEFELKEKNRQYLELWDGITVFAEKNEEFENLENNLFLNHERINYKIRVIFISLIVLIEVINLSINSSYLNIFLSLSTLVGVYFAILISESELGYFNKGFEYLCKNDEYSICETLIKNDDFTILKVLKFSDLPIIWFSSWHILLTISSLGSFTSSIFPTLGLLNILTLPFTLTSIYLQRFRLKKWCVICLCIISVLWIQAYTFTAHKFYINITDISLRAIVLSSFIIVLVGWAWLFLVKPTFISLKENRNVIYRLSRLKNDNSTFCGLLRSQKMISRNEKFKNLQIGNPCSKIQFTIVCSLYCAPCARAHALLDKLIEKYGVGVSIVLSVNLSQESDKRNIASQYIISLIYNRPSLFMREVFSDWFKNMNFEIFKRKYPIVDAENGLDVLNSHKEWVRENEIVYTPTIYFNNYLFPRHYDLFDLEKIIRNFESVGKTSIT